MRAVFSPFCHDFITLSCQWDESLTQKRRKLSQLKHLTTSTFIQMYFLWSIVLYVCRIFIHLNWFSQSDCTNMCPTSRKTRRKSFDVHAFSAQLIKRLDFLFFLIHFVLLKQNKENRINWSKHCRLSNSLTTVRKLKTYRKRWILKIVAVGIVYFWWNRSKQRWLLLWLVWWLWL